MLICGHGYHETCFRILGLRCPHCFNYLSDSIEELSLSYNQRLQMNENIDICMDPQVHDDDGDELDNAETILKQTGIDTELKKKISGKLIHFSFNFNLIFIYSIIVTKFSTEFVENCIPVVESTEMLPISGSIGGSALRDITNITGFK